MITLIYILSPLYRNAGGEFPVSLALAYLILIELVIELALLSTIAAIGMVRAYRAERRTTVRRWADRHQGWRAS